MININILKIYLQIEICLKYIFEKFSSSAVEVKNKMSKNVFLVNCVVYAEYIKNLFVFLAEDKIKININGKPKEFDAEKVHNFFTIKPADFSRRKIWMQYKHFGLQFERNDIILYQPIFNLYGAYCHATLFKLNVRES